VKSLTILAWVLIGSAATYHFIGLFVARVFVGLQL
jgi:hypothetical protein